MIKIVRKSTGFTLIEIMIVIAIIAILAAILLPNFVRSRARAQQTACETNLRNLATAVQTYSSGNYGRYPTQLSDATPGYIQAIPTCPSCSSNTYRSGYGVASNPEPIL